MDKAKDNTNIQSNHTLSEYQRYFSHLLKKGKLNRFPLNARNKLDSNRQYWKIKDEKGTYYFYELPKYIKPDDKSSAYSFHRIMHRRPARATILILASTVVLSITSFFVAKKVFHSVPDVPDTPVVDFDGLEKSIADFQDWEKAHQGEDASKHFTVGEMANTAMGMTLYDPSTRPTEVGKHYERRPLLSVGYGHTTTYAVLEVDVDVNNAFIYQNGDALEESISFSSSILAPKVGCRDFYTKSNDIVDSHAGDATSRDSADWHIESDPKRPPCTAKEYQDKAGKSPISPFLYSINDETILATDKSNAKKVDDGYEINIDLDTEKGVENYKRRIYYLSDKYAENFTYVNINITTDNELCLKSFTVKEKYYIGGILETVGSMSTQYYYDDVPNIPAFDEKFNYSKYPQAK